MTPSVQSVQTGKIAPLGPRRVPSGFTKTARSDAVAVTVLGLEGDEQADLTAHNVDTRTDVFGLRYRPLCR